MPRRPVALLIALTACSAGACIADRPAQQEQLAKKEVRPSSDETSRAGGATRSSEGTNTGGMSTDGTANACSDPDTTVCTNVIGRHCGYTYEYWKDRGSGCLTNTPDGFRVEWSNVHNLLGRKGLRPGSMSQVVTYSANYRPNGTSHLSVYGWTRGPLVEYYIVESWGARRPSDGPSLGTVNSDGGSYDIYRTERVNQPSIDGTRTFSQYWSVRTEKRTSGIISVANHFNAWQDLGLKLGSLYEVSMNVEGYQSSGAAEVSVSMR